MPGGQIGKQMLEHPHRKIDLLLGQPVGVVAQIVVAARLDDERLAISQGVLLDRFGRKVYSRALQRQKPTKKEPASVIGGGRSR